MREVGPLLALVDQTLGSLFSPDRHPQLRSPIVARLYNAREPEWLECSVFLPAQYIAEVVEALEHKLLAEQCRLNVRPL